VYAGEGGSAVVEKLEAWVGLKGVWPDRPADSSSALVWDTVEQTNNYTWWSGN
jgi:beta-fructofuranosidase